MTLNPNTGSLEFWAQEQFLRNTDDSINIGALQLVWPGQSKAKFEAQLKGMGYSVLPKPSEVELSNVEHISYEEFLELYEFGTPVREYILQAAKRNKRLTRETLFSWVKDMKPNKVENYGRDYSSVRV